jgi:hypothetical protein
MVAQTLAKTDSGQGVPIETAKMRTVPEMDVVENVRRSLLEKDGRDIIITGIKKSFLNSSTSLADTYGDFNIVVSNGKLVCFGSRQTCVTSTSDYIHNLPIEASWAAKYAGLSERAAVDLVSRNTEEILGIEVKEEERDIVVFESNPLEFGASVVVSIDGSNMSVMEFRPEAK